MPALPWSERHPTDPGRDYVAMASRLPLKRYRSVPGFLRDTLAIRRQLGHADGLVGYGLNADLFHKTFLTFSVWEDRPSLETFAGSDPHRTIIQRLAPRMGRTRFEFFAISGSRVPMPWPEVATRLTESPPAGETT